MNVTECYQSDCRDWLEKIERNVEDPVESYIPIVGISGWNDNEYRILGHGRGTGSTVSLESEAA